MSGQPINTLSQNTEINGNLMPAASLQGAIAAINAYNIADSSANFATSAAASLTITNLQNLTQRLTNGGAVTVTLDSAYNIINTIPNAFSGQSWMHVIATNAATTVATPTLSDTAITLSGTTTVLAAAARWYQAQITQLTTTLGSAVTSGTTFTSLTQVGSTNNYTVALGTNAISPVVGNAFFLGVTAGTLPPGWYPVNKVTSATSFVIAAPISSVAWTATAATIPGTATVPSSAYTLGMPGLYSPLMTITGMFATVTATISV
jgi:hypothetical protein